MRSSAKTNVKGVRDGLVISAAVMLWAALFLACPQAGICAEAPDPADPTVAKLEAKFFQHTYPREELSKRLDRIEKMVFGETKTGDDKERLANLLIAVPASSLSAPTEDGGSKTAAGSTAPESPAPRGAQSDSGEAASRPQARDDEASSGTQYPAVTAIEQKLLGKSFASEPVTKRLARLETKVYGKPSASTDLGERMDSLKQRTGIVITKQAPQGSDWADDDDIMIPTSPPVARRSSSDNSLSFNSPEDGLSFSGRDLRQDFQKAFGRPAGGGGATSGGATSRGATSGGATSPGSDPDADLDSFPTMEQGTPPSGAYGFGGSSYPKTAPSYSGGAPSTMAGRVSSKGLSQTVSELEKEVLSKTYSHDKLADRLTRLEQAVFPKRAPATDKSLPERVHDLVATVGLPVDSSQKVAQGQQQDMNFGPNGVQQRNGGLGKLMNSIGQMMNGGYAGGYPMRSGNLVTDPSTGMLIDPMTGNLIDPSSGMVIGRRVTTPGMGMGGVGMGMPGVTMGGMGMPGMGMPGMGMPGMGMGMGGIGGIGMPGFSNGFSPYGMTGGTGIGIGGMRFGGGGLGSGMGMGGMWP